MSNIRSMQLPQMMMQKQERYLPSAFDDSLTILEKMNKMIEQFNKVTVTFNDTLTLLADVTEEQDLKIADLQAQIDLLKG